MQQKSLFLVDVFLTPFPVENNPKARSYDQCSDIPAVSGQSKGFNTCAALKYVLDISNKLLRITVIDAKM